MGEITQWEQHYIGPTHDTLSLTHTRLTHTRVTQMVLLLCKCSFIKFINVIKISALMIFTVIQLCGTT